MTASQRPAGRQPQISYDSTARTFDHERLASLPSYGALRQALSDLGNEIGDMELADWLAAVKDMAVTARFGDVCVQCEDEHRRMWWPHAAERSDWAIRGRYRPRVGLLLPRQHDAGES